VPLPAEQRQAEPDQVEGDLTGVVVVRRQPGQPRLLSRQQQVRLGRLG